MVQKLIDVEIEVAKGVTVTVTDDLNKRKSIYRQLKISRKIMNPDMVTFTHPDVVRICESYGIHIRQFKSLSRDQKRTALSVLEGIKSYHLDLDEECDRHAGFIVRFDDIFDPGSKKEARFRKDIQTLVDQSKVDVGSYTTDWFDDPEDVGAFEPTPYTRNPMSPAEQRLPMIDAFATDICPTFNLMVDAQLMGETVEPQQLESGSEKDSDGFPAK